MDFILSFVSQTASTVGVIYLFGFLIAVCNKLFYRNLGGAGTAVCYATGFIGTPVHECSHALFCLLFGHKIEEIKLFTVSSEDGTLGYVSHSYNGKNLYQNVGNLFIGVAPILCMSALLILLGKLLIPQTINEISAIIGGTEITFSNFLSVFSAVASAFFSGANGWLWWIFLIIGICLSLHMNLSGADIKGSLRGLAFFAVMLLVVDLALYFFNRGAFNFFTKTLNIGGSYLLLILSFSLFFAVIALAVSAVVRIIKR